jgi:hypothetical protein
LAVFDVAALPSRDDDRRDRAAMVSHGMMVWRAATSGKLGSVCKVRETKAPRFIVLVCAFRSGGKLNSHGGTVHGGVLSLLFDKAMGWAYECLRLRGWDDDRINGTTATVTANHATINPNNSVSNSVSSSNSSKSSWTSNF